MALVFLTMRGVLLPTLVFYYLLCRHLEPWQQQLGSRRTVHLVFGLIVGIGCIGFVREWGGHMLYAYHNLQRADGGLAPGYREMARNPQTEYFGSDNNCSVYKFGFVYAEKMIRDTPLRAMQRVDLELIKLPKLSQPQ